MLQISAVLTPVFFYANCQQSATFGHVWPVCVIPHGLRGVPASSKLLDKEGAGAEAYKVKT
eukprot:scaffold247306_cov19-Tisochrysis_lutea.AAC.3